MSHSSYGVNIIFYTLIREEISNLIIEGVRYVKTILGYFRFIFGFYFCCL